MKIPPWLLLAVVSLFAGTQAWDAAHYKKMLRLEEKRIGILQHTIDIQQHMINTQQRSIDIQGRTLCKVEGYYVAWVILQDYEISQLKFRIANK